MWVEKRAHEEYDRMVDAITDDLPSEENNDGEVKEPTLYRTK